MTTSLFRLGVLGLVLVMGCGGGATSDDAAIAVDGGVDAALATDAGHDAASAPDAGSDAGNDAAVIATDTGVHDAAVIAHLDGGTSWTGDCNSDDDCPGGHCIAITPDNFRTCQFPPVESTGCVDGRADNCCTTADCATGQCFLEPMSHCGGLIRLAGNQCMSAECQTNSDCDSTQACVPAGTLDSVALCVDAGCRADADCTDETGGRCVLGGNPCCHVFNQLVCVYPSDGCRASSDCASGQHCIITDGRAQCMSGGLICPG